MKYTIEVIHKHYKECGYFYITDPAKGHISFTRNNALRMGLLKTIFYLIIIAIKYPIYINVRITKI